MTNNMALLKRGSSVLRRVCSGIVELAWKQESLMIFRILPAQVHSVTPLQQRVTFSSQDAADLPAAALDVLELPGNLREEVRTARADQRLHMVRVGDAVASWGFSVQPSGTWPLTETHSSLDVERGAVCLFAFETIEQYRGRRLYPALLSSILAERFHEGATAAYIWCAIDNRASYASIKRVGFLEVATHRYLRLLGFPFRSSSTP